MRKIDSKKNTIGGKAQKTINFDKIVLMKIEERAVALKTNASNLVNILCRQTVLSDVTFFREMKKMHYMKMQEFDYLIKQAEAIVDVGEEKNAMHA